MPEDDAQRWNARYSLGNCSSVVPRPWLVDHADILPSHGYALDVAMGLGANAAFLLSRGLHVVGVDISDVALRKAKQEYPAIMAVQADLTYFYLPPQSFDVILNFFYLQRDLWSEYVRALKTGGLLFIETLTQEMLKIKPDLAPSYLLNPGELEYSFPDLETLYYEEGWKQGREGHMRAVASLIARKP